MNNLNFITQAYEDEADTVICSATMIQRLYSDSTFYIYDGGLNEETRHSLKSFDCVKIVDWSAEAHYEVGVKERMRISVQNFIENNTYLKHILDNKLDMQPFSESLVRKMDFLFRQKPYSILDLSNKVDKNVVWIDADVVPVNRFDEVFEEGFDIGGTVRSKYEQRYRTAKNSLNSAALNSGVIFFNTDSDRIAALVKTWLKNIKKMGLVKTREQKALSKIFMHSNQEIYKKYYNSGMISIDEYCLRTRVFPCRKYNHFRFLSGIDPQENKILHFKEGNASSSKRINQKLINDIREGNLEKWHRKRDCCRVSS